MFKTKAMAVAVFFLLQCRRRQCLQQSSTLYTHHIITTSPNTLTKQHKLPLPALSQELVGETKLPIPLLTNQYIRRVSNQQDGPTFLVIQLCLRQLKEPISAAAHEAHGTVFNTCPVRKLNFWTTTVGHSRRIQHGSASVEPKRKCCRPERSGADLPAAQQLDKLCSPHYTCAMPLQNLCDFMHCKGLEQVTLAFQV